MSEVSRKVSILLNIELDQKVSKDEAEEIANQIEAIAGDELWSTVLEQAAVDANVISVDAEVVEIEDFDEVDEDEALEEDPEEEGSETKGDPED